MFKKVFVFIIFSLSLGEFAKANLNVKARTAILQDFYSGEIIYEKEADISIYPASMTKIMTSIIAFDLIKSGDLSLDEKFIISEKAWRLSTSGNFPRPKYGVFLLPSLFGFWSYEIVSYLYFPITRRFFLKTKSQISPSDFLSMKPYGNKS